MAGPSVLVIRRSDRFSEVLSGAGFAVENLELIRTGPVDNFGELDARIEQLDRYDGLFFTSSAAAEIFVDRLGASGTAARPKAYVLGDRARAGIEQAGFEIVNDRLANTAEELIGSFDDEEFAGKRLLFVRGSKTVGTISRMLGAKAELDEVVVYRTVHLTPDPAAVDAIRGRFDRAKIDWICFFSPSAVLRFGELFGRSKASQVSVAAIGATTAAEIERSGLRLQFTAARANAEDFAAELIEHIKRID